MERRLRVGDYWYTVTNAPSSQQDWEPLIPRVERQIRAADAENPAWTVFGGYVRVAGHVMQVVPLGPVHA